MRVVTTSVKNGERSVCPQVSCPQVSGLWCSGGDEFGLAHRLLLSPAPQPDQSSQSLLFPGLKVNDCRQRGAVR